MWATVAYFGRLNTLVTSVGMQRYGNAVSTSGETWDEVIDVNVKGVFLPARATLPHPHQSVAGRKVIVASTQAAASQQSLMAYTASNGALVASTGTIAIDETAYGVGINGVSSDSINTPMLRTSAELFTGGSYERIGQMQATCDRAHSAVIIGNHSEVGEVVSFPTSCRSGFVMGTNVRADGGLLAALCALIPARTDQLPASVTQDDVRSGERR